MIGDNRFNIFVFILSPEKKVFELVSIPCLRSSTVGDALNSIKFHSTDPSFLGQKFVGIYRMVDNGNPWIDVNQRMGEIAGNMPSGEVFVAIPEQWTKDQCNGKVAKIMAKNPKLFKIIEHPNRMVAPGRKRVTNLGLRKSISSSSLRSNFSNTSLASIAEEEVHSRQ